MFFALVRLLRPHQWAKNILVFTAWVFTIGQGSRELIFPALAAFGAMCLLSSGTYVFNDLFDLKRDRAHPKKKNRPLASGKVPVSAAIAVGCPLLVGGLVWSFVLGTSVLSISAVYLIIQVLYNLVLKQVPIADVFSVASGFVLRPVIGAVAIGVPISGWLLCCTGTLALMLGFAKRRHELRDENTDQTKTRESLSRYSVESLNGLFLVSAGSALITYLIYVLESPTAKAHPNLVFTAIFVIYAILHYVHLVLGRGEGGEPDKLVFQDAQLVLCLLGFTATAVWAMLGGAA